MTKFDRIADKLAGTWDQRPDYEALTGDLSCSAPPEMFSQTLFSSSIA